MLIPAILLFFLALILLLLSNRQRRASGIPGGQIIYSDMRAWEMTEAPLYDPILGLTGKPDYLVQQKDGSLVPVEVKSSNAPTGPYDSHIYQLAAYCYLVERTTGKRPSHGILHYNNQTYRIDYSSELENALLDLVAEIRMAERRKTINRSHESGRRCARCGYQWTCEEALA
jgi:CRISPR-associated exonuclease Cas4